MTIERIRRFAAGTDTPVDRAWLVEALQEYLCEAARGLRIDQALDLVPRRGQAAWWKVQARMERDHALQSFARTLQPNLLLEERAEALTAALNRYRAASWLNDRRLTELPPAYAGTPKEFLWRALKADARPISVRHLRRILSGSSRPK